jgi:hypothetical protein
VLRSLFFLLGKIPFPIVFWGCVFAQDRWLRKAIERRRRGEANSFDRMVKVRKSGGSESRETFEKFKGERLRAGLHVLLWATKYPIDAADAVNEYMNVTFPEDSYARRRLRRNLIRLYSEVAKMPSLTAQQRTIVSETVDALGEPAVDDEAE